MLLLLHKHPFPYHSVSIVGDHSLWTVGITMHDGREIHRTIWGIKEIVGMCVVRSILPHCPILPVHSIVINDFTIPITLYNPISTISPSPTMRIMKSDCILPNWYIPPTILVLWTFTWKTLWYWTISMSWHERVSIDVPLCMRYHNPSTLPTTL